MEEFIDGEFIKYVSNTGIPCGVDSEIRQKCESLAHFSYERPDENIMVVDMQGSGYVSFDPEIASRELLDGEEVLVSAGNLSITAITTFIENHSDCNLYCTLFMVHTGLTTFYSRTFPGLFQDFLTTSKESVSTVTSKEESFLQLFQHGT